MFSSFYQQTSGKQSRERFLKELDGIWFDHIPNALRSEWENCKRGTSYLIHFVIEPSIALTNN